MQFTSNIQSRRTFDSSENALAWTQCEEMLVCYCYCCCCCVFLNISLHLFESCRKYYAIHAHTSIDLMIMMVTTPLLLLSKRKSTTKYASTGELDHEKINVYMEFCESHKTRKRKIFRPNIEYGVFFFASYRKKIALLSISIGINEFYYLDYTLIWLQISIHSCRIFFICLLKNFYHSWNLDFDMNFKIFERK